METRKNLKNRLGTAEDEIHGTLDGAKVIVVPSLTIPQSVLQTKETTSIE